VKVKLFAADEGGCGHYRMIWPCQAAVAATSDVEFDLIRQGSEHAQLAVTMRNEMTADGVIPTVVGIEDMDCDVAVFQRPRHSFIVESIPFIQRQGVKVVVELDDDFLFIHHKNAAYASRKGKPEERNRSNMALLKACGLADRVICSTPAIAARFAKNTDHRIVINRVPEWLYGYSPRNDPNVIGWSGTLKTHPNDLHPLRGPLGRVLGEMGEDWQFRVIGDRVGIKEACGVEPDDFIEWVPLHDYPQAMGTMDVGVVPLEFSPFNEAKSHLKGLEFAANGVPYVATPTQAYRMAHDEFGLGLLAKKPHDFYRQMKSLMSMSYDGRREIGAAMREQVLTRHSISNNIGEWIEAWTDWSGATGRTR